MKSAIVTGVSSGIGAAIAQRLLSEGWVVFGLSRRRPSFQHEHLYHRTIDLSDPTDSAALQDLPAFDALVHAAGILRLDHLGTSRANADGETMWRLHVDAAVRLADAVVPGMPDGGRIVLIGSRASKGSANRAQYAASKAALSGLATSWALELVPRRITANIISPAAADTAMGQDPARAGVKPKVPPFGSLIDPTEIAGLASFLLSADARNITGQEIFVCGGASL
jgi:3-oxoacyl-[acyl-carrier protein] reductase